MFISVILPVYNAETFVEDAVRSILNQTYKEFELIIIDDNSKDNSLNIVNELAKEDKRIIILKNKENLKLSNTLNLGILASKGKYIARMDADDISVSNRFELQLAEFKSNTKLDILGGQIAEFYHDPNKITSHRKVPTTQLEIEKFARRRNPFNHPAVMYKKTTILRLGLYDINAIRIEDYDLWLRALHNQCVCSNLDMVLVHYRSTLNSMKRRKTFISLKNHIQARTKFYSRKYISFIDLCYGISTQIILFLLPTKIATIIFSKVARI
jgi:glycosyltransferase involved in cell wall biosynthesis